MRRLLLRACLISTVGVAVIAAAASVFVYRVYFAHLDYVDSVLAGLPPAEATPPEAFKRAVLVLDAHLFESWVAHGFVTNTAAKRLPQIEWHVREFIWGDLLPRRLSQDQLVSLYAHFLQFRGGRGLVYGAQLHYSQAPDTLTERQLVELLLISRAPAVYSQPENKDRLGAQVERSMALLAVPAA